MKQVKPIWISEPEAAQMAGLDSKTFRRYVKQGKLSIGWYKITKKAEPRYNKVDIEMLQAERSVLPAA